MPKLKPAHAHHIATDTFVGQYQTVNGNIDIYTRPYHIDGFFCTVLRYGSRPDDYTIWVSQDNAASAVIVNEGGLHV